MSDNKKNVKRYELTDEHRAQLPAWRDKWIANAMSTASMTDEDRRIVREAIKGLYEAADLPPPRPESIVFVKSPIAAHFAAGFASAIVAAREQGKELAGDPSVKIPEAVSTDDIEKHPWYTPIGPSMQALAKQLAGRDAKLLLDAANSCFSMRNGGNQWSGYVAYLSFFRHVAKLGETHGVDYSKWQHYEAAAEHSGPRYMHRDFCIVSDRPELLTVDEQNRPHNESGPFCRWRDGFALYAIHGVRVPRYIVERPDLISVDKIHKETNEEVRRVMIERYGLTRYVRDAGFEVLDESTDSLGLPRRLLRRDDMLVVELVNSTLDADGTRRVYHVPVHPELRPMLSTGGLGEPQGLTALNAVASTFGLTGNEYVLEVET